MMFSRDVQSFLATSSQTGPLEPPKMVIHLHEEAIHV